MHHNAMYNSLFFFFPVWILQMINFQNQTLGIRDPSVFKIPDICKYGTNPENRNVLKYIPFSKFD